MTEVTHTEEVVTGEVVEDDKPKTFLETPGHEHFKPLKVVKGSDQMRLIAQLQKLGVMTDDKKKTEANLDLEQMADLIDFVGEKYTHDTEKFEEFTMGEGGFERAMEVVIAYASLMGEGNSSGR